MLRYGIVGLGHGRNHIPAVAATGDAAVTCICDRDPSRLREAASQYNLAPENCFTDMNRMLACDRLDAVIIATDTASHAPLSVAALQAGKHLFLEKPLALDMAAGLEIVKAAERPGAPVAQIGYCVRSSALVAKVREILQSGNIGKAMLMWYNMFLVEHLEPDAWRNARHGQGGKLFDCCCHYFDMMFYEADSRFARVCAFGGPPRSCGPNADDLPEVTNVIVELENGVRVTLNLSSVTPSKICSLCGIAGDRGQLDIDPWSPDGAGSISMISDNRLYTTTIVVNGAIASRGHLGFDEQHRHFIASIRNKAPVICTPRDAMELQIFSAALDLSLAKGCVVSRADVAPTGW
jgi:myo-inositol 2-dehydrogenase/D-chiro-inositol 1-dehydrogenase